MTKSLRLLLVDDERSLREPLAKYLRKQFGYEVESAATFDEAMNKVGVAEGSFHVALIDDMLTFTDEAEPQPMGVELMVAIREHSPETEFILFTGWGLDSGLEAMRAGAYRFIRKPFDLEELGFMIEHAAEYRRLKRQLETTEQEKEWLQTFLEIGKATTSQLEFDQVLGEVHKQVGYVMDASNLDIVLYDEKEQVLRFELGFDNGEKEEKWERPFTTEKGFTDWVIGHQSLLLKDIPNEEPPVPPYREGWPARSWLGVPLTVRGDVIGAITVQSDESNQFDETDRGILATVASQVASAIANAMLFAQETQYVKQLEELRKTSLALGKQIEEKPLLQEIIERAIVLTDARSGGIYKYDKERGELTVVADFPGGRNVEGRTLKVGEGMAGQLVQNDKRYMIVPNYSQWPGKAPIYTEGHPFGAVIEVLLKWRDEIVGVLYVEDQVGRVFAVDDANLLQLFADHAAIALKNADELQRSQSARQRLRDSFEASIALRIAKEPQRVLEDLVVKACQVANASWVSLSLIDKKGNARSILHKGGGGVDNVEPIIRPDGISMQVMKSGEPYLIEDVQKQSKQVKQVNKRLIEKNIGAAACLPFSLHGERIGVMWFHYDQPQRFQPYEVDALQLFANQAAAAYDNARKIETLEHMHQAAKSLSGEDNLDKVLQQIVKSAKQVLGASSAAIWSYDNARNLFIPTESVAEGIEPDVWDKFRKNDPKPGQTAETVMEREWIGVEDVSDTQEYDFMGETTRDSLQEIGVKSFQGVALKVGGEKLGVIYVNYARARSFSKEEQRITKTFADLVALALKKARLLRRIRQAKETAGIVAEMTVLRDLPNTLEAIVKGTKDALDCDAVVLYAYDREKKQLAHPPTMIRVREPEKAQRLRIVERDSIAYAMLNQDEVVIVPDVSTDSRFKNSRFTREEAIASVIAIPLSVRDERVGVMFVNYRNPHRFSEEEIADIHLFANQAAVAIHDSQVYEREQKRSNSLRAIQEISAEVSSVLDVGQVLDLIAKKSAEAFDVKATSVMLWDDERENLIIKAASGLDETYQNQQRIARSVVDRFTPKGRIIPQIFPIGGEPLGDRQLVEQAGLKSVLVAPLTASDDKLSGVLNIYSKSEEKRFTEQDKELAAIFANHASIALQNAKRYEELKKAKGLIDTRTALALMGIGNNSWRHSTIKHALTILEQTDLLYTDLNKPGHLELMASLYDRFEIIRRSARKISERPSNVPLSSEESIKSFSINKLVDDRVNRLWENDPYRNIEYSTKFDLPQHILILVNYEAWRQIFDILIDNAVDAIEKSDRQYIEIGTKFGDNCCQVYISDTGKGIPSELQNRIGESFIDKPNDAKGLGMGLVIAQTLVQSYGGTIKIGKTDLNGTTMILEFPYTE